jgi:hypothetical protein
MSGELYHLGPVQLRPWPPLQSSQPLRRGCTYSTMLGTVRQRWTVSGCTGTMRCWLTGTPSAKTLCTTRPSEANTSQRRATLGAIFTPLLDPTLVKTRRYASCLVLLHLPCIHPAVHPPPPQLSRLPSKSSQLPLLGLAFLSPVAAGQTRRLWTCTFE